MKTLIKDIISRYGYKVAKERFGVKALKEHDLLSALDKARENLGVDISKNTGNKARTIIL